MFKVGRWFSFTAPEEQKKHEQEYFQKVFPFGEAQKQREQELLLQCVKAPVGESEKMYQLLLLKSILTEKDPAALDSGLTEWYHSILLKKWPEAARAALLSMAQLSLRADRIDALPNEECILTYAKQIEAETLPKLKSKRKSIWRR